MDLYLIRHGACCDSTAEFYDDEKNTMNPPLTEEGVKQAQKLAERCKDIGLNAVYSSDLLRALQTSQIIASAVKCGLSVSPALREIDMGDIYKKSWDHYPELYAKWALHREDLPYPNGENGADVWKRCSALLLQIVREPHEKVAIVAHGGTIRSIVCGVLGIAQQKRFRFGAPLENCSITVVKYIEAKNQYFLHTFNDFSHLKAI